MFRTPLGLTKRLNRPTVKAVSLLSQWLRALAVILLCTLMSTPAAVHTRVCLIAMGVMDDPGCCAPVSCCEREAERSEQAPTWLAAGQDCHCCLELSIEGRGPLLAQAGGPGADWSVAGSLIPSFMSAMIAPQPNRTLRTIVSRTAWRPRPSAPIPLRI
jgi:hypothetical protein